MPLPNLLIPGAQKAGTTYLYNVLEQHPDVAVSSIKEPHFFNLDQNFERGASYYETFFPNSAGHKIVMEATPAYLALRDTAERILRVLGPDLRLIFMFRHPVERAFSHYRMSKSGSMLNQGESFTFEEAFHSTKASKLEGSFYDQGLYSEKLQPFLERFRRDRMLFLVFEEDVVQNFERTLDRVFEFLEIPPVALNLEVSRHPGGAPRVEAVNKMIFDDRSMLKRVARTLIPSMALRHRLRHKVLELNKKPTDDKLDPALRASLLESYRDDIRKLEEITGRDLSVWR